MTYDGRAICAGEGCSEPVTHATGGYCSSCTLERLGWTGAGEW